jgi:acetyl esterase/lipase
MSERMAANPDMDLPTLRAMFEGLAAQTAEPEGVTYAEVAADGVPALWCIPTECRSDVVILYTHGGGFAANSASSHRKLAGHLAAAAGARAFVIDYRLAPEYPYPAQLDDAVTAYRWLRRDSSEPLKIVAAGDSAGGNLAIALALKLRQLGHKGPDGVVVISPWLDMEHLGATLDDNAGRDALINRGLVQLMAAMYLGGGGGSATDPLVNPLHADLTDFPPVYIAVGDAEALLDDTRRFADRVEKFGGVVEVEIAPDQQHVYPLMAGRAPEADATIAAAGAWLRTVLNKAQ